MIGAEFFGFISLGFTITRQDRNLDAFIFQYYTQGYYKEYFPFHTMQLVQFDLYERPNTTTSFAILFPMTSDHQSKVEPLKIGTIG